MIDIKLENKKGNILHISHGSPFSLIEIQGLNPSGATINTSETALIDGSRYNSSKINAKQMIIAFSIDSDPEKNRIEMYKVLKTKEYIKFYYDGYYRKAYIDGYIDSIDITYFDVKQIVTVSFLCPSPFFRDAQEIVNDADSLVSMFYFPFAITEAEKIPLGYIDKAKNVTVVNEGDVPCGMSIELYARNKVINPKIFNYITTEYLGLNFTMQTGDVIYINTAQGSKTIQLMRNGKISNIFNSLMRGSVWHQLEAGDNIFTHDFEYGVDSIQILYKHYNLFEGV